MKSAFFAVFLSMAVSPALAANSVDTDPSASPITAADLAKVAASVSQLGQRVDSLERKADAQRPDCVCTEARQPKSDPNNPYGRFDYTDGT